MSRVVVALVSTALVAAAGLFPATAAAQPCGDIQVASPAAVAGSWIVAKGDSRWDRRVSCQRAREIAKRYIRTREASRPWRCRHTRSQKNCTKGGTYEDEFGNRLPRYQILWHRPD